MKQAEKMPPKIWADSPFGHKHAGDWSDGTHSIDNATLYIRADRVEKLVEALRAAQFAARLDGRYADADDLMDVLTEWEAEQ